jgi:uncharacterized integral membrane protein (TIGR00698 family)
MLRAFTRHPETVGESYSEHMGSSWSFGRTLLVAACCCFIHGLFPFLCEKGGSNRIRVLHDRMVAHRDRSHAERKASAAPGLVVALLLGFLASLAAPLIHVPAVPLALFAGMGVAAFGVRAKTALIPGLALAERPLLKVGVALLGWRIAPHDVASLGWETAGLVLACVAITLVLGTLIGRLFGLERPFAALSASATAICGASAAVAVSSVLPQGKTTEKQTTYVIAAVATLSTVAMIVYPLISQGLGLGPAAAAVFIGGSIHDVAQVAGAGYAINPEVGALAVTVKLLRVALLAFVVLGVGALFRNKASTEPQAKLTLIPWFLLAFFAFIGARWAGFEPPVLVKGAADLSTLLLAAGVVAIGAKTSLTDLRQMGWRPMAALVCQALLIGGLAFGAAVIVQG